MTPLSAQRGDQTPNLVLLAPAFSALPLVSLDDESTRSTTPRAGEGSASCLLAAVSIVIAWGHDSSPLVKTGGASTPQFGAVKYGLNRPKKGAAAPLFAQL